MLAAAMCPRTNTRGREPQALQTEYESLAFELQLDFSFTDAQHARTFDEVAFEDTLIAYHRDRIAINHRGSLQNEGWDRHIVLVQREDDSEVGR